ncbi:MAG TPA: DUF1993 domain-containing protein [Reyranella sp.]|nr:DUF1993 domain-containing protein [Reyranella sp.]
MKLSMHAMAIESFVPMLESLSEILGKGREGESGIYLVDARLAPDMYTLAQQVRLACDHAKDGAARLAGLLAPRFADDEKSLEALQGRIAQTVGYLKGLAPSAFAGAEDRDSSIALGGGKIIAMDGLQFLRLWALPHFYFHVVTAYGILRHNGVAIGKRDYMSYIGAFIRDAA